MMIAITMVVVIVTMTSSSRTTAISTSAATDTSKVVIILITATMTMFKITKNVVAMDKKNMHPRQFSRRPARSDARVRVKKAPCKRGLCREPSVCPNVLE